MTDAPLPSVTFVIPVRDDARRLARCLRSIAANEYPNDLVDVVVVDNGSKDGSHLVAHAAGSTVLRLASGVAALRNAGAAQARGEIVAFVDADHELDAQWLLTLAGCMRQPAVAAAGAPYTAPPDGTWVQRAYDGLRERVVGRRPVEWLASGNMAVRRRVFEELGGFDEAMDTCEDVDLCQRVRAGGGVILGDEGLKSVHHGDPATVKGLFFGELWRGRDNLRATLRGPKDFRHFRSLLVPVVYLAALTAGTIGVLSLTRRGALVASIAVGTCVLLSAIRAQYMVRRTRRAAPAPIAQALVVAAVYDCARALALVVRVGHGSRRVGENPVHVEAH